MKDPLVLLGGVGVVERNGTTVAIRHGGSVGIHDSDLTLADVYFPSISTRPCRDKP